MSEQKYWRNANLAQAKVEREEEDQSRKLQSRSWHPSKCQMLQKASAACVTSLLSCIICLAR